MQTRTMYEDRTDAGKQLAEQLVKYEGNLNTVVLGLPRGGVVLGYEVAKRLHLQQDIIVPRKIGAPMNEEYAVGAITEDGQVNLDMDVLRTLGLTENDLASTIQKEKEEAKRRLEVYRGGRPGVNLRGKNVILVDDGIATGSTMKAALTSAKARGANRVIVAVPVASPRSLEGLRAMADEWVILSAPQNFRAVGQFYKRFGQTSDEEVIHLLEVENKEFQQEHLFKPNNNDNIVNNNNFLSSKQTGGIH